jgi:beta-mannanase
MTSHVLIGLYQKIRPLLLAGVILVIGMTQSGQVSRVFANDASTTQTVLLGIYTDKYMDTTAIGEITSLDAWVTGNPSGRSTSMVGINIDLAATSAVISTELNNIWNNGYTPVIYLGTTKTAYDIASGSYDQTINAWAQGYKSWAGGTKMAIIAALPEGNTSWKSYGGNSGNYKMAFNRIESLFAQDGVPSTAVRWMFVANGYSTLLFEDYYPGNQAVQIIAFSAYNFGGCSFHPIPPYTKQWDLPAAVFFPLLERIRNLAPTKSIFAATIGTTEINASGAVDAAAKNQWLQDAYAYLKQSAGVQGILYLNSDRSYECNWAVYHKSGSTYSGYRTAAIAGGFDYAPPTSVSGYPFTFDLPYKSFMPLALNSHYDWGANLPLLVGVYPNGSLAFQSTFDSEVRPMDNWVGGIANGRATSIVGAFSTFIYSSQAQYDDLVQNLLTRIWDNGYVPFVNIAADDTAYNMANGSNYEAGMVAWAQSFKKYALSGNHFAFIAPLQEMSGSWVKYHGDPASYKAVFTKFRNIFKQQGVPDNAVSWVFAPNGWSDPGLPHFEEYYPGNNLVDEVAISAYNNGNCMPGLAWQSPEVVYNDPSSPTEGRYLDRLRAMAPNKPIIIAQTGSSDWYQGAIRADMKNSWLVSAYNYLATQADVQAVIYYNYDGTVPGQTSCHWPVYIVNGTHYTGYKTGVNNPAYGFVDQYDIMKFGSFFTSQH